MGGISFPHLLIFLVILFLFFGANRIPALGKSLGEAIRGFKKGLNDEEIDVTNTTRKEQIREGQAEDGTQARQTETKKDRV